MRGARLRENGVHVDSAEITGVVRVPPGPEYLHDAVFYQIYPQRDRGPLPPEAGGEGPSPAGGPHRTVKMTSEGGEYRVTVPGRSYSIYRLER